MPLKNSIIETNNNLVSNNIQQLLENYGIKNIDYEINLSESQKKAFSLFKHHKNILILGSAGTGKSFLLKTFQEYIKINYPEKCLCLTSTTGISAYNIGGITIHSFMGIGTGDKDLNILLKQIAKKKIYIERITTVDILIIDEISMLSANIFEKLNLICQHFRNNKLFFGGIQLIFTGDMNQLLCVFNTNKQIYKEIDERLIIESDVFNKEFSKNSKNIIVLNENFRQKNDIEFINLLSRLRIGKYTKQDLNLLESRKITNFKLPDSNIHTDNIVHLVCTNAKAQAINTFNINKLSENELEYNATFSVTGSNKELNDILIKELEYQFKLKGIHKLILKKGARVMLIKNLDTELGLVNGALGTILDITNTSSGFFPIVQFDKNNVTQLIENYTSELTIDHSKALAIQIPLMLAYACTIHKIQGSTLDSAILDIEDAFVDHQVYVGISRVKTLNGLYFKSFNHNKIKVNKKTTLFLENLK